MYSRDTQGAVGSYPRSSPRLLRMTRESALANLAAAIRKTRQSGVKRLKLVALSRWQAVTLGVVLTFAVSAGWAASAPTLTATAVRITDHPAYVQAVVQFSGPSMAFNQVRATDPAPSDGTANVLVSYPNVAGHVSLVTAHGLSVRVAEVPYGLSVGIGALPGVFKYLSYGVVGGDELVVDLWTSTFPPAGNIARGSRNCLTLGRVNVTPGLVTASGTAGRLFESRFRAVLRGFDGRVLAARSLTASGRWKVALHYTEPQGQGGYFEAAASSAKDGALVCLVQRAFALPASNRRANLHVVYRAYADVNGDGRLDLVTLRHTSNSKGQLTVALSGGGRLSVTTSADAVWLPGLVASGNVDGRPGEEVFVDVGHVTTAESISIYTDWQGALVRAGTLSAYGYDYGVLSGLTCSAQGTRHFITQHDFHIKFGTRQQWMRQDTVYVWRGPRLELLARRAATRLPGQPSPALVGVQCGHAPRMAPAADPAAYGPGLASVSFVSSRTAFVLGSAPCAHAPCTVILRTLDRGRSWSRLTAPAEAISIPDGPGLWGLRFADALHGYAYGAGLWTTSTGARSWQPMKAPGRTVLALATARDRELVAVISACRSVGCAKGVGLYHRPIGTGTWKRFAVNTSRGTAFDDAIAVRGNVVWMLTGYDLYVSSDGGRSFRPHPQPCHAPHGGIGIPYPGGISDDGPHTYLLCLGSGYTGGVQKYLYRTTGTASGWREVGQPPSPGGSDGFVAGNDRAIVIAAVSGASSLDRSTDGGRRWRIVLSYGDGGAGWADLSFTSALDGAVIHAPAPLSSTGQLLLTGDGGRTWHAASLAAAASAAQAPRVSERSASSVLAGTWRRLPAAPTPAPTGLTVSVWTGRQMVVFGRAYPKPPEGIDVAAAYTPASKSWRRLAPLKGPVGNFQGRYHAVWTGKEMLVFGPDDFQAYDPRSHRWRRPAPAPAGVDGSGLVAWTGRELIDWGGGCCGDALSTGWAFDPARNTWRKLPSSPLAPNQVPVGVWTGHEMIVLVSGIDPDGKPYPASFARIAAYNPVTNSWRRLAPLPAARFGASVIWDGHELLVMGGAGAPRPGKPAPLARIGFALDPATDRWRRLSPMPSGRENFAAVWTGRKLLIWGGTTTTGGPPQSPPSGLAFDPRANSWSRLPRSPLTGRVNPTAVWTGRALILWGASTVSPRYKTFAEGAVFTPAAR